MWVGGEGWKRFNYPSEETSQALKERGITIGNGASIGYGVSIGYEASIGDEASIGNGASIGDRASSDKTIFLTGSRNTVNYYGMDMIHIGCIRKTIAEWQERYREVGMENGYSDEQIQEYGAYIQMIAELHKTWNIETPAAQ